MHNTSSQLYNYVTNLILNYFQAQKIQHGDRFNLYLEDPKTIEQLYTALQEQSSVSTVPFSYTHPDGGEAYATFCLMIEDTKVIIASSAYASEDYFTMLRNKVADQKDVFEGTAILILFSGKLDSLLGGSGSLSKEGMPLHFSRFKSQIEQDIDHNTSLQKYEKIILKAVLDRKTKSVVEDNNTIFDYEQVINSLVKGKIQTKDYRHLGLFPQAELASKNGTLEKDLVDNFKLYEKFENIFLHGNPASDLEQDLPETAVTKFIKEDWHEFDYGQIVTWMDKEKEKKPPVFQALEYNKLFQTIWKREDGESVAKKRNINLIAFNPSIETPFTVSVRFDQFIKKDGLSVKVGAKNISVSSSGYSIVLEFTNFDADDLFSLVEYRDPDTDKRYVIRILHLPFESTALSAFEGTFQLHVQKNQSFLFLKEQANYIFNPNGSIPTQDILKLDTTFSIQEDQQLLLNYDYALAQEELIHFKVNLFGIPIPVAIKSDFEALKPITGIDVWKEKRENRLDFKFLKEGGIIKLLFKNNEKTVSGEFRTNLLQEEQLINSKAYSWILGNENKIFDNDLVLNSSIKEAFNDLRLYYQTKKLLPSLTYLNDEINLLATKYVSCFIQQLDKLEENKSLSQEQKNLFWLGVVKEQGGEEKIKFSPLHPLNVAYQLQLQNDLKDETVYNAILKRLSPYNLVPYIEGKPNEIYIPIESSHSPEWLYYTVYLNSKQAVPKSFVSDLVSDKIKDFTTNFEFLFDDKKQSPLKINVINLGNCKEVVDGIFNYYCKYLNLHLTKRLSDLLPIEIHIYGF